MAQAQPPPISAEELRGRRERVERVARSLGFVGRVEYRHEYRGTGGAQYGLARQPDADLLVVDAAAFGRQDEISLQAIVAHERGHQLLFRDSGLRAFLMRWNGHHTEEILASAIGSLLVTNEEDEKSLMYKAIGEAIKAGAEPEDAIWLVGELRLKLEALL